MHDLLQISASGLTYKAASSLPAVAAALPAPDIMQGRQRPSPGPERVPATGALRVLIVEDDPPVRHACAEIAASVGYLVETADTVPAARTHLERTGFDIVLLDLRLPGGSGAWLLEEIRTAYPRVFVIVMTAFATVNSAVEVMRNGAGDFLAKPFALEELAAVLQRAAERRHWSEETRALQEKLRAGHGSGLLIGNSAPMEKLFRIVSKVAFTGHPVLITGEAGTGKEAVAHAIHANGPNATSPFVPVDCGSLQPASLEAELFGYGKNAFPGASRPKTGLLGAAGDGTVFFDEIGELAPDLQVRLLRALHERSVRPVGGGDPIPLRARLLAASSRDLMRAVETGGFRKDLYYRLNVVNVRVPSLRERKADILPLAEAVLDRVRRERNTAYTFSDESLRLINEYDWPGNVRELEHAIERACALSSGPMLHLADLPTQLQNFEHDAHERAAAAVAAAEDRAGAFLTIEQMEKQAIRNALQQLKGDKLLAAKLLGIGKTTLYRKLKEYGIEDSE